MLLRWPSHAPALARPGCGHGWLAELETKLCDGWQFVDAKDPRWLDLLLLLRARPHLRTTLVVPEEVACLTWDDIIKRRVVDGPEITTSDLVDLASPLLLPLSPLPAPHQQAADSLTDVGRHHHEYKIDRIIILVEAGVCADTCDRNGATVLLTACREGWTDVVKALAENSAELSCYSGGQTPLFTAAEHNHLDIMSILLSHGVNADATSRTDWFTPLGVACALGHVEAARILLEAGANAAHHDINGMKPLDTVLDPSQEYETGTRFALTRLLVAYGAKRSTGRVAGHDDAVTAALACEAEETAAWLTRTDKWRTDLHFMEVHPLEAVKRMLRRGASPLARIIDEEHDCAGPNDQPPGHDVLTALEVAEQLCDAGRAPAGSPAALVLDVSRPWSPATHQLFPAAARKRAVTLLMLGRQLSAAFARESESFFDAWREHVLPHAVHRHTGQELTLRIRCPLPSFGGRGAPVPVTYKLLVTAEEASSLSSLELACRHKQSVQWLRGDPLVTPAHWASVPAPLSFKWGHTSDGEPVDETSLDSAVTNAAMLANCMPPGGEQALAKAYSKALCFEHSASVFLSNRYGFGQVKDELCLTVTR